MVEDRALSPTRAVVVDDAPEYQRLAETALRGEGFAVTVASLGEEALDVVRAVEPDVIVLDVVLPDLSGVEVCRRVRTFSDAYIIMVTAKSEEVDKLAGLSVGADDYLVKPYSPRELTARIRAMLRRPRTRDAPADRRSFGDLLIRPSAREVFLRGRPVELTRIEFDLLDALSANPQVVLTRERLMDQVWGPNWRGEPHLIDVHIANLRKKLGDVGPPYRYVRTIRGVGFRMGTSG